MVRKFKLNGAGIINNDRLIDVCKEAGGLLDNRFAIINGLMFDLLTIEGLSGPDDIGYSCIVSVYDALECFNPSHGHDIASAYKPKHFIVGFEYYVSPALCDEDNQHCIDAERNGEALFMHLIEHALKDSNNTVTRFRNFAIGLDLAHIETVGYLGEPVTKGEGGR